MIEDRTEALEMYAGGVDVSDIAAELGIGVSTVYAWLAKADAITYVRERRNGQILNAYEDGMPVDIVCERYNVSTASLYRILNAHRAELRGPTPPKQPPSRPLDEDLVEEMYRDINIKIAEICRRLKVHPRRIYSVLKKRNVPRRYRKGLSAHLE